MRHKKKTTTLSRTTGERKALFSNLSKQFFTYGRIQTTTAKAKALKGIVEPMITRAKSGTLNDRRVVAKVLKDRKLIKKLFDEVAPIYKERNGGYTRILKLKNRKGDNAEISIIELVDKEKVYVKETKEEKAKNEKAAKADKKKEPKKDAKKEPKAKKEDKKEDKPKKEEKAKKEVKKADKKDDKKK